ncbi:MAG TPA: hypothetical protein VFE47_17320 [Tepidisphaeraceae bacterium]|jgi:hypothetical protein|nr:hypothetical protein [Tepidisphaeraceae bacterium]
MSEEFATAGGITVEASDVALAIKLGQDRGLLEEILLRRLAAARAQREGVSAQADDIDQAFADFCAERELFSQPLVDAWLARRKLSADTVRAFLRETILAEKMKEHLAPDPAIRQRFAASPYDFAKVNVQIIQFPSEGAAAETLLQLREGECTWEQAVAQAGQMQASELRRCDSPPAAAGLFVAAAGDFCGPIECDEGGFNLYRVIRAIEPKLDDELIVELRDNISRETLLASLASDPLEYRR